MGIRTAIQGVRSAMRVIAHAGRAVWLFFSERRPAPKPDHPLVVKVVYPGGAATRDFSFPLRTVWKAKIAVAVVFVLFFVGLAAIGDAAYSRWRLYHLNAQLREAQTNEQLTLEMRRQLAEIWLINERLQRMLGRHESYRTRQTVVYRLPQGLPVSRWVGVAFGVPNALPEDMRACYLCAPGSLVLATADGKVTDLSWDPRNGDVVTIDYGEGVTARYGRDALFFVEKDELVRKAQPIGVIHAPDSLSTPLLFYQVTAEGEEVETVPYMVVGGTTGIYTE